MGRKPKIAKQLDVLEDDHLINKIPQNDLIPLNDTSMPLKTDVQSSLMDFLAESLASDDLNMFNTLPNIAPEPLVECADKNDMLPLLEAANNDNANFYENSTTALIKAEPMDLNGHLYNDFNAQLLLNEKLKSFFANTQFEQQHDVNHLSGSFTTSHHEDSLGNFVNEEIPL